MAYNPNLYAPYTPMVSQTTPTWYYPPAPTTAQATGQPVNGLVSVTGIEGARAYQLPPNSKMPLFDQDADVLYLKTTDAAGYPTVKAFRFEPIETQEPSAGYVTREDFDALVERVDRLTPAATKTTRTVSRKASDGE